MRYLDTILRPDPRARRFRPTSRCVGDGIEAVDVAFFGPMVYFRSHDHDHALDEEA